MLTYAAETRAEINKTKPFLNTCKMKVLCMLHENTLYDRCPNGELRTRYNVQKINKFTRIRIKCWNAERMHPSRLIIRVKDNTNHAKRDRGRPPKR